MEPIRNKMLKLVVIMCLCFCMVKGDWQKILPWQVKTTLLEISYQTDIHFIRGDPLPVYRKDLSNDYKAYWYIPINTNEYLILSTSSETGDYKMVLQGKSPSIIDELNTKVSRTNGTCSYYYMMTPTPDINMACEDDTGKMVFSDYGIVFTKEDHDTLQKLWKHQREEVEREHIWDKSIFHQDKPALFFHRVSGGDNHQIVVGDNRGIKLEIVTTDGDLSDEEEHSRVCQLLKICHHEEPTQINPQLFEKSKYGQEFFNLQVPEMKDEKMIHLVLVTTQDNTKLGRQFMVEPNHRSKRQASWITKSINDEVYFPDYTQHDHDCKKGWFWNKKKVKCCAVGCGPVAWAMILGYYDRRSHSKPSTYGTGSQSLYKCSLPSGSSGCQAPLSTTSAVKQFTEYLNDELGTFCLSGQGATTQGSMKKIESYFKKNQKSGYPSVIVKSKGLGSLVGLYNDKIRDDAINYLDSKWPVVVGFRVSGIFSQHYAVATRYRKRSKEECKKNFWGKRKCRRSTEYEMYVHMGWGGSKNGWRPAKMFFAGVAKY